VLPRLTDLRRDDTHRLIPSAYSGGDESVLARLTDDPGELAALFELEGATNDRLLGEAGLLPGITVRELVFGLSYSHIVNAAFTHTRPGSGGVVYNSVRHKAGTCIACFRPALVNNVRKGSSISIAFDSALAAPEIRELKA
jgi:hypothetical protein